MCVLLGGSGSVKSLKGEGGGGKDRPPVFVEAGRPAPLGFLGDLGGGGCDGQEGFSEPETVTHCSSTPLAWVAKIVKSWTFINLPRRADWLEPGPPPLAMSMGFSATAPTQPPRGDRLGSVQIIRPLTPCLVTEQKAGWGGGQQRAESGGSQRKRGTGLRQWICLSKMWKVRL